MSDGRQAESHAAVETEYGIVRQVVEQSPEGTHRYQVEITLPGTCDRCVIRENCYGAGSVVEAVSHELLEPGEDVRLEMRRGTVLKATAWVYGVPLAALVAGIAIGHQWLFASLAEQPRVLLSFGTGVGLLLATGYLLSRLNHWVGERLTITARRIQAGPRPYAR